MTIIQKGLQLMYTLLLIVFIAWLFYTPTDDSDKSFFKRSGLAVHTDYKTGLQYLRAPWGGVVPRLDKDGKHMRVEE